MSACIFDGKHGKAQEEESTARYPNNIDICRSVNQSLEVYITIAIRWCYINPSVTQHETHYRGRHNVAWGMEDSTLPHRLQLSAHRTVHWCLKF